MTKKPQKIKQNQKPKTPQKWKGNPKQNSARWNTALLERLGQEIKNSFSTFIPHSILYLIFCTFASFCTFSVWSQTFTSLELQMHLLRGCLYIGAHFMLSEEEQNTVVSSLSCQTVFWVVTSAASLSFVSQNCCYCCYLSTT